jgi:quercetin dioxygenase-like cupin family protein
VRPTVRAAALSLGAGLLLAGAGCAQPGQLGHSAPAPAAPVVAPQVGAGAAGAEGAADAPAAPATVAPVSGTVDGRVTIRTPGPAVASVRTVVLAPGEALGWQRLPGTELAVVRSGDVSLVREGACTPVRFGEGEALFVGDAVPHRLVNDGTDPAELVVTTLLAPDAPAATQVDSACPAD